MLTGALLRGSLPAGAAAELPAAGAGALRGPAGAAALASGRGSCVPGLPAVLAPCGSVLPWPVFGDESGVWLVAKSCLLASGAGCCRPGGSCTAWPLRVRVLRLSERLDSVLSSLYEALRLSALLVAPYMPGTSRRIWGQLGLEGSPLDFVYDDFAWGAGAGTAVRKAEVLFPRIDLEAWKKERAEMAAKGKAPQEESPEHEPEIGIEAFRAVEMRVAQIVKVEEIPKSRKLYKLEVDLGYERRTVCSGIKAFFAPEELEGRCVVLVTNLKPAKLCGIESNGMILAASVKVDGNSEALTLVVPAGDIPLGSRVS